MCKHPSSVVVAFNTGQYPLVQLKVPLRFKGGGGFSGYGARYCPDCATWLPATESEVTREFARQHPVGKPRSARAERRECRHSVKAMRLWPDMQRMVCRCGRTYKIGNRRVEKRAVAEMMKELKNAQ